jgi:integrase
MLHRRHNYRRHQLSTTHPIRAKQQIRALTEYYLNRGELRNHLLIVMGLHTALRVGDLLRLTWDDVYDFDTCRFRSDITLTEKKTGKTKIVKLNRCIIQALKKYIHAAKQGVFLFLNKRTGEAISRIQAYRIIRAAAEALDFQFRVSCHSLRKTFGYLAWKAGVSPAIIMEIYNHSSFAVTKRYLGLTQDDTDEVYLKLAELV